MDAAVLRELGDDGVLLLTLNRPDKKNAFDRAQWIGFRDALTDAGQDPAVACVVVTGAGDDFSAGADLTDFAGEDDDHPFVSSARALIDFDKPVVSAAKGVAVGGGATLLLHTDVVYVGESLRLRFPFASLGLVPEWGSSYQLQAVIGARQAAELMYTAQWLDAEQAVAFGIATAVVPDDELLERSLAKAREIAQWPVTSLVATKKLLRDVHRPALHAAMEAEQDGMSALVGSPENVEAIMAFIQKRPPDFGQFRREPTRQNGGS